MLEKRARTGRYIIDACQIAEAWVQCGRVLNNRQVATREPTPDPVPVSSALSAPAQASPAVVPAAPTALEYAAAPAVDGVVCTRHGCQLTITLLPRTKTVVIRIAAMLLLIGGSAISGYVYFTRDRTSFGYRTLGLSAGILFLVWFGAVARSLATALQHRTIEIDPERFRFGVRGIGVASRQEWPLAIISGFQCLRLPIYQDLSRTWVLRLWQIGGQAWDIHVGSRNQVQAVRAAIDDFCRSQLRLAPDFAESRAEIPQRRRLTVEIVPGKWSFLFARPIFCWQTILLVIPFIAAFWCLDMVARGNPKGVLREILDNDFPRPLFRVPLLAGAFWGITVAVIAKLRRKKHIVVMGGKLFLIEHAPVRPACEDWECSVIAALRLQPASTGKPDRARLMLALLDGREFELVDNEPRAEVEWVLEYLLSLFRRAGLPAGGPYPAAPIVLEAQPPEKPMEIPLV